MYTSPDVVTRQGCYMGKSKLMAIRFDMELYNKIDKHELPNSDLVRNAVLQYLNGSRQDAPEKIEKVEDAIDDDEVYNEVYNTLYNTEVLPLKHDIKHLQEKIDMLNQSIYDLKSDKLFLQKQLHAQTLIAASRTPLLTRIKTKFLKDHGE